MKEKSQWRRKGLPAVSVAVVLATAGCEPSESNAYNSQALREPIRPTVSRIDSLGHGYEILQLGGNVFSINTYKDTRRRGSIEYQQDAIEEVSAVCPVKNITPMGEYELYAGTGFDGYQDFTLITTEANENKSCGIENGRLVFTANKPK